MARGLIDPPFRESGPGAAALVGGVAEEDLEEHVAALGGGGVRGVEEVVLVGGALGAEGLHAGFVAYCYWVVVGGLG